MYHMKARHSVSTVLCQYEGFIRYISPILKVVIQLIRDDFQVSLIVVPSVVMVVTDDIVVLDLNGVFLI